MYKINGILCLVHIIFYIHNMLPPIPFDKIVEYFTDPHVLKTTHPQQLKE